MQEKCFTFIKIEKLAYTFNLEEKLSIKGFTYYLNWLDEGDTYFRKKY
jgi:hypothetical protein